MNKKRSDIIAPSFVLNKRGEKVSIFWWFIACVAVFLTILFVTLGFYAKPIDVRELQVKMNYLSFYDCFIENGFLKQDVLTDKFSVNSCGFNSDIMKNNSGYLKANITDYTGKQLKFFFIGDTSMSGDCNVSTNSEGKYFPNCYYKKEPFYYYENNERKIGYAEILSASNNHGTRVSVLEGKNG